MHGINMPLVRASTWRTDRRRTAAPARTPGLVAALALVLAAAFGTAVLPSAAEAACTCRCVDGKAKAVCSMSTDIPPICNAALCPRITPKRSPLELQKAPPPIKPGCQNKMVYNPETGRHEWGQICQ